MGSGRAELVEVIDDQVMEAEREAVFDGDGGETDLGEAASSALRKHRVAGPQVAQQGVVESCVVGVDGKLKEVRSGAVVKRGEAALDHQGERLATTGRVIKDCGVGIEQRSELGDLTAQ